MKVPQSVQRFVRKNGSTILTCVGAVGVIGTAVLTAKAATKTSRILSEAEQKKGAKLTKFEKVKEAGPAYIPAVLLGATTIACIFGANILNKKQQAAMASAYALLDQSFKEYRKKVIDIYGEEADEKIEEEIFKDKYNYDENGNKLLLYYDDYSKRYFEATASQVGKAEYDLNRDLMMRDYAYLDEFYNSLGLEPVDNFTKGWSTWMNLEMYWQTWVDFGHSKITLDDGRECIVIYIYQEPMEEFEDYC